MLLQLLGHVSRSYYSYYSYYGATTVLLQLLGHVSRSTMTITSGVIVHGRGGQADARRSVT